MEGALPNFGPPPANSSWALILVKPLSWGFILHINYNTMYHFLRILAKGFHLQVVIFKRAF